MGYKKNLTSPFSYRQFSNNPTELFNHTMTNLMDNYYDNALSEATDGSFKAVCLSGIKTEDNTGGGTDDNDAKITAKYLDVIVRPLAPFGDILPDPLFMQDASTLNQVIAMHASVFVARSDFEFKDTTPPLFGQILNCYFEHGSVTNSDFRGLRFSEFKATEIHPEYKELSTMEGITLMEDRDWSNASQLGSEDPATATESGKSSNIKGDRKGLIQYIVIHYSAALGSKEAVLKYENSNTDYGYHYMIDRDGSHFDTAPTNKIVWHAGGNKNVKNSNSVGICLMNVGFEREGVVAKSNWVSGKYPNINKQGKWEPYSEASLEKAATICAEVLKLNNLTTDRIVGHSDIQTNKSDPGPAFNMENFRAKVKSKMGA